MKKITLSLIIAVLAAALFTGCASAPEGTSEDGLSFSGTYDDAGKYWEYKKDDLEDYAGDRNFIFSYAAKEQAAGGSDITITITPQSKFDELKIVDNNTGNVLYILYSDSTTDDRGPYAGDSGKEFLDKSFSTSWNDYGLGDDVFDFLNNYFPKVDWDD
jgi:uncharacterized secreted protein with C-terminal beta-propeller domain